MTDTVKKTLHTHIRTYSKSRQGIVYRVLQKESSGVIDDPLTHPSDGLLCTRWSVAEYGKPWWVCGRLAHTIDTTKPFLVEVFTTDNDWLDSLLLCKLARFSTTILACNNKKVKSPLYMCVYVYVCVYT